MAKKISLPPHKVISTIAKHGNTSAASIPLAFDIAWKDGRIKKNDIVLMEAMGSGLTWGACILRV
jgi:3-oxoacyl-[acyl-carrier-protein] synthase-3